MTAALPLSWPGSRTLLGWWRELADLGVERLWLSQLLFHRVEAEVGVAHARRLDALQQALLRAVCLHALSGSLPLDLHLDPQVQARWLDQLVGEGLVVEVGDGWELTGAGRQALESGSVIAETRERRVFYFVDNTSLGRPNHFVPLGSPRHVTFPAEGDGAFDAALLEECIRQTPDWKARFGFPSEVNRLYRVSAGEEAPDWRGVILDRLEQMLVLLLQLPGPGACGTGASPALVGFPVRPEGWALDRTAPVLTLGPGWEEVFPDLAEAPEPEAWRQAWLTWCQPRSVPLSEAEACRLEHSGHHLKVQAPQRLIDRLKAARSDAVKNETWLLAGSGRTRAAALVELVESR